MISLTKRRYSTWKGRSFWFNSEAVTEHLRDSEGQNMRGFWKRKSSSSGTGHCKLKYCSAHVITEAPLWDAPAYQSSAQSHLAEPLAWASLLSWFGFYKRPWVFSLTYGAIFRVILGFQSLHRQSRSRAWQKEKVLDENQRKWQYSGNFWLCREKWKGLTGQTKPYKPLISLGTWGGNWTRTGLSPEGF